MTDTRAGFWLLFAIVALTVAVVAVAVVFGDAKDQTLREMLAVAVAPASVLLPIVGILLVTSEWSQRTAHDHVHARAARSRVLAAKLLAGVVLALVALRAVHRRRRRRHRVAAPGDRRTRGRCPSACSASTSSRSGTGMLTGVGFGAVLLASAPAIVL